MYYRDQEDRRNFILKTDIEKPSPLKVKEVIVDDRLYIVFLSMKKARKDTADRQTIVEDMK